MTQRKIQGDQIEIGGKSLPDSGGTAGQVLVVGSPESQFVYADQSGGGGGLTAVVDDPSPQLGGNLDANGRDIDDVNGLDMDGTLQIFDAGRSRVANIQVTGAEVSLNATVGTQWRFQNNTQVRSGNALEVYDSANTNYLQFRHTGTEGQLRALGAADLLLLSGGDIKIDGLTWPTSDGSNGQVLTTDGAGNLSFTTVAGGGGGIDNIVEDTTPQLGGNLDVNGFNLFNSSGSPGVVTVANDFVVTNPNVGGISLVGIGSASSNASVLFSNKLAITTGTGFANIQGLASSVNVTGTSVDIQGITYPAADGSNGQVLTTDGSGNLSFTTPASAGISSIVEDTTPQLGGILNGGGFNITNVDDFVMDGTLQVLSAANTAQLTIFHDNSNAQLSTTSGSFQFNDNVQLRTGALIEIFDSANSVYAKISGNANGALYEAVNGPMNMVASTHIAAFSPFRFADSGPGTSYGELAHDQTDLNWSFVGTGDLNLTGLSGGINVGGSRVLTEAPADGNQYVRSDNGWEVVNAANSQINDQTGTAYVAQSSDVGKTIVMNNASASTVTVNTGQFSKEDEFFILQKGAGLVTVVAGPGVTINTTTTLVSAGQYSVIGIKCYDPEVFVAFGERATS